LALTALYFSFPFLFLSFPFLSFPVFIPSFNTIFTTSSFSFSFSFRSRRLECFPVKTKATTKVLNSADSESPLPYNLQEPPSQEPLSSQEPPSSESPHSPQQPSPLPGVTENRQIQCHLTGPPPPRRPQQPSPLPGVTENRQIQCHLDSSSYFPVQVRGFSSKNAVTWIGEVPLKGVE
jgi:hypothetical protein